MVLNVRQWIGQESERLRLLLVELVEAAISVAVTAIGLMAFGVLLAAIGPAVLVLLASAPLWAVVMVLFAL